jgi:L-fuculokinase
MNRDVVIVLDCGATNIRAMAVDAQGKVIAKAAVENASQAAKEHEQWSNWSLDAILQRFTHCCTRLMEPLAGFRIHAVSVTTFGVDGALVDKQGKLLDPIISWKCPRTVEIMGDIARYISPDELQRLSGVGHFSFNTLYKLVWLKENRPSLWERAHAWLFISSLINHRLTGKFTTDRTMAGTSQLLDLQQETFSDVILRSIGLSDALFPPMIAPGEVVGPLLPEMAQRLGLPAGIPVISAGHDTQFAQFGSGAELEQPVLSSGTWEILMVRTPKVETTLLSQRSGSTCELDSCRGLYNPGLQWLASGVLEWIRKLYWRDVALPQVYERMILEAAAVMPGADGVVMNCDLLGSQAMAGWQGVNLNTHRGHFYRSALEGLSYQLRQNLHMLQEISQFQARELIVVGGGGQNPLWNQIKADITDLPIKVLRDAETTVLGAAMFAWYGSGYYASVEQAREQVEFRYHYYYPSENRLLYQNNRAR